MRKKKNLLNLALLLSLGTVSFGPNMNVVFAQEPADEIILEDDESQVDEVSGESDENSKSEFNISELEEPTSSIDLDDNESKSTLEKYTESDQSVSDNEYENNSLNQAAFYSNSDLEIEDGVLVKYNGSDASVKIPSSVTKIGDYAFSETSIKNVTIPSSVTYIGEYAFSKSDLENVTIPDSVTEIRNGAFAYCSHPMPLSQ